MVRVPDPVRTGLRLALAAFLATAGIAHFVVTDTFRAQVPPFLPFPTAIILVSGVVEVALAVALVVVRVRRVRLGRLVALFFLMVLPGNLSQAITGADAFGLDTPTARWVRIALHPLLWVWALSATDAWPRRSPEGRTDALR